MRRWRVSLLCAGACAASAAAGPEPDCRVSLYVEPERPFVEQAVHWRLEIESRSAAERVVWLEAPAFPGARVERVTVLPATPLEAGWRLHREERVLFAERAGPLPLPSARLACSPEEAHAALTIPARQLEVLSLPTAGRPPDFQGLVGPVTLRRYLRPETLSLGASARVTVSLRGAGNVWAAPDPHLDLSLEHVELFPLPPETGIERGGGLRVTKVFSADLVPRRSGTLRLPPLRFSWFDPQTGRYRTEAAPALELPVTEPLPAQPGAPAPPGPAQAARSEPQATHGAPHEAGRSNAPRGLLPAAWAWIAVRAAIVLGLVAVSAGFLRRRRAQGAPTGAAGEPEPDDTAARAERALRGALAKRVPAATRLAPAELLARDDLSPAQRAAAELLVRVERSRFDRDAEPPPREEIARRIEALRSS